MKNIKYLLIILSVIGIASLACNLGQRLATPTPTVLVSTEAVEDLEEAVEDAIDEAEQSGMINLEVTESQLTSLVVSELEKSGTESILNPQIQLDNDQLQFTAKVNTSGLSAQVEAIMEVDIDGAGRPVFNVTSASLGPFPVPADLVSEMEIQMNQAFQDQIDEVAPGLFIESIVIEDGTMVITGQLQQ
jgi:uncharacterized protein YpmS